MSPFEVAVVHARDREIDQKSHRRRFSRARLFARHTEAEKEPCYVRQDSPYWVQNVVNLPRATPYVCVRSYDAEAVLGRSCKIIVQLLRLLLSGWQQIHPPNTLLFDSHVSR